MSAALEASDVVKRYGEVVVLDRVSLTARRGEAVAIVGESGSGKTTLLRCFNRMVEPDGGTVRVQGRDVASADGVELRRSLGYVQQEGGLLPHWTVERNAAMVPWLRGQDDPGDRARSALDLVGLPPERFGGRWPRELSGGQRQRVAIARALAAGPSVLLMDEPFGALDAITRADLRAAVGDLRRRLEVTVLLVTHDLDEAAELGDRIAVMKDGRIRRDAPPEELLRDPGDPYVAELVERSRPAAT